METMKKIMYGVTDFALMRAENGYFVDRTAEVFGGAVAACKEAWSSGKDRCDG